MKGRFVDNKPARFYTDENNILTKHREGELMGKDELELTRKRLEAAEKIIFDLVFRDKWDGAFDFVGLPKPCTLKQYKEVRNMYLASIGSPIPRKGGSKA